MNENPYNPPGSPLVVDTSQKGAVELLALNFLRHWNGKAKLASAFWMHFILGNLLLTLIMALGTRVIRGLLGENLILTIFQIALVLLGLVYYICTVRFIWVCARNTSYSGFFYITRGLIILVMLFLAGIFTITFLEAYTSFGKP